MDEDVLEPEEAPLEATDSVPETGYLPKTVNSIAQEVIAGHWGRGNDRKRRLAEAGWDPNEVLAEVDKIFGR